MFTETKKRLAGEPLSGAPIKAPALNLTLGSAGTLGLATALTAFNDSFEFVFGNDASDTLRASVLIATIAAITIIVAVDMLARAYAAHSDRRLVLPWPRDWKANVVQPGEDLADCVVAGARASALNADAIEYLLVDGGHSEWYPAEQVRLTPPAD